jgi:hypothetical protein
VWWSKDEETLFFVLGRGRALRVRHSQAKACSMVLEADDLMDALLGKQWGGLVIVNSNSNNNNKITES